MTNNSEQLTLRHLFEAKRRIQSLMKKSPLKKSHHLSERLDANVYVKMEMTNEIGAFKLRGAANKMLALTEMEKKRGITTFSTGNHGLAIAFLAGVLGIRAVICISNRVPNAKVDSLKRLGAEVKVIGESQDDAENECQRLKEQEGLTVIPPFDDPYVIAGQGTIALELMEDLPSIDQVVIPLSGGGLLSGIGLGLKEVDPSIGVKAVSIEGASAMEKSLQAGKPVAVPEKTTLADSLLGGIGQTNRYTLPLVKKYMDELVLVNEEEIAEGMRFLLTKEKIIAEGAAATGISALLKDADSVKGQTIAVILTGNNVAPDVLASLLSEG
ncbi:pyridoxal-phosphate dependent enzyme [Desertibacillus haloalkaliphilus]|uniref:pyridoxal-phosphate dependent enzyme n=1 Tax=Desertibacillus haloalkaliphilus TaxID=1328930 RepID=UPI001C251E1D|nr:pyridoxal-phosphate dependent enzyme [Desertibacillus haloalkaliphilus]MBU8908032.1 pyridoxal-phosphate dependent enzyme [Desertibacillus haloalkaliphilus]